MRRKPTAKPLSELLPGVLRPALERHGLATSQIITRWKEIAGEELAAVTRPLRINWPRQKQETASDVKNMPGATLVLLVESAFALEVQHAAPLILEHINALYGWAAVAKITLRQGPVKKANSEWRVANRGETFHKKQDLSSVKDDALRLALLRFSWNINNKSDT